MLGVIEMGPVLVLFDVKSADAVDPPMQDEREYRGSGEQEAVGVSSAASGVWKTVPDIKLTPGAWRAPKRPSSRHRYPRPAPPTANSPRASV